MSMTRKDTPRQIPDTEGWECREHLDKMEAERLLDWLEAHGCRAARSLVHRGPRLHRALAAPMIHPGAEQRDESPRYFRTGRRHPPTQSSPNDPAPRRWMKRSPAFTSLHPADGSALPMTPPGGGPARALPVVPGYEILDEFWVSGGMGVVYKARQIQLNRLVALKMILAGGHAGEAELARFRTEAEAVARLQHPNIVQIHEVGEHDGLPYFSLEFCAGGSLAQKLGGTPLPPPEAAGLVETLARAMRRGPSARHRPPRPEAGQRAAGRATARPRSPTSAWPSSWTTPARRRPAPSWARRATWRPEQADGQASEIGPAGRRLRPGGHPLRVPDRPAALQGGDGAGDAGCRCVTQEPVPPRRCSPQVAARPGNDLSEVPGKGAGASATPRPEAWPTTCAASWTASRSAPGRSARGTRGQVGEAPSDVGGPAGRERRGARGPFDDGRRVDRAAVAVESSPVRRGYTSQ